jgi:hypothetical protein
MGHVLSMARRNHHAVVVVGPTVRARVRALVEQRSVDGAAQALGIGRATVLRLVAGLGVRRGTAHLAINALDRVDGAGPTEPEIA